MPLKRVSSGGKRKSSMSHGFRSKAQWRYFFANPKLRRYAKKEAHKTPGGPVVRYKRLPERKGKPTGRTLR